MRSKPDDSLRRLPGCSFLSGLGVGAQPPRLCESLSSSARDGLNLDEAEVANQTQRNFRDRPKKKAIIKNSGEKKKEPTYYNNTKQNLSTITTPFIFLNINLSQLRFRFHLTRSSPLFRFTWQTLWIRALFVVTRSHESFDGHMNDDFEW